MRKIRLGLLMLLGFAALADASETVFPPPLGQINDFAKVLDPSSSSRLQTIAETIRRDTGTELSIVTVFHTGDRAPQQFAEALFEEWGLNKRKRSLLLLLVLKEKRLWTLAGPEVEAAAADYVRTDALLGRPRDELEKGQNTEALMSAALELGDQVRQGFQALEVLAEIQKSSSAAESKVDNLLQDLSPMDGSGLSVFRRAVQGFSFVLVLAGALAASWFLVTYLLQERIADRTFWTVGASAAAVPLLLYVLGIASGRTAWLGLFLAAETAVLGRFIWMHRCPQCELWMDIRHELVDPKAARADRQTRRIEDCRFCGHQKATLSKVRAAKTKTAPQPETKESRFRLSPEDSKPKPQAPAHTSRPKGWPR